MSGARIIAHRGASVQAPENTLPAFRMAEEAGADWMELDVQMTADGLPICLHDLGLQRTTDAPERFPQREFYRARDFRWQEVGALDAGAWFSPSFRGTRVPLLREVADPAYYDSVDQALDAVCVYARGVALPDSEVTLELLERVRSRGLWVFVWTVNDPQRMRALMVLGVDGLITDDPGLALRVRRESASPSS